MPKPSAVSVTTSATRLDTADDTADHQAGQSIIVYNNSSVTVYVGDATVTTANGLPVAANSYGPGMDLQSAEALYGIVVSGTAEVRVFETGVG